MTKRYRWASPAEWLDDKISEWDMTRLVQECRNLARLLDNDQIQDEYQTEMEQDGYFNPLKGGKE